VRRRPLRHAVTVSDDLAELRWDDREKLISLTTGQLGDGCLPAGLQHLQRTPVPLEYLVMSSDLRLSGVAVLVDPRTLEDLDAYLAADGTHLSSELLDRIDQIVPPGVTVNVAHNKCCRSPSGPVSAHRRPRVRALSTSLTRRFRREFSVESTAPLIAQPASTRPPLRFRPSADVTTTPLVCPPSYCAGPVPKSPKGLGRSHQPIRHPTMDRWLTATIAVRPDSHARDQLMARARA
jgi:hypothetical protein